MRLIPPRPTGEDYFLACITFSRRPVDEFWTVSKCFTGSWLAIHRFLHCFSEHRNMNIRVYQGKEVVRIVLAELSRQTALHSEGIRSQPNNRMAGAGKE